MYSKNDRIKILEQWISLYEKKAMFADRMSEKHEYLRKAYLCRAERDLLLK